MQWRAVNSMPDEVIDQQIPTHPGRHPKQRRKPQTDRVLTLHDAFLSLGFCPTIERDGVERCLLSAVDVASSNTVSAVRRRQDHQLRRADHICKLSNSNLVYLHCFLNMLIAQRR